MIIDGKRALAYTARVDDIIEIEGADNIELAKVKGWTLVVKKGEFRKGELGVYFEIDSKLPEAPWSEFLKDKGFKVKTMKLNKFNVVSQGLLLPLSSLPLGFMMDDEHVDLTDHLRVKHVEDDFVHISNKMSAKEKADRWDKLVGYYHPKLVTTKLFEKFHKYKWFKILFPVPAPLDTRFPSEISKTDEERIENLPNLLGTRNWIVTEKLDGTSATYLLRKKKKEYEFVICSRNRRITEPDDIYWPIADAYQIQRALLKQLSSYPGAEWACLQGEIVGPKINGNRLDLSQRKFYAFNFIVQGKGRLNSIQAKALFPTLTWVPILETNHTLPSTMEDMKKEAEGKSVVNPTRNREGLVYRATNDSRSFKNVSNEYLLKVGKKEK